MFTVFWTAVLLSPFIGAAGGASYGLYKCVREVKVTYGRMYRGKGLR